MPGKLESEEETSSNIAIQEIVLGLLWVQRYISNFNGDPTRVTLSGHGAAGRNAYIQYIHTYIQKCIHEMLTCHRGDC